MHFCIEGLDQENHGAWPKGWRDHIGLAQTKLQELTKLKNVSRLGFQAPGKNLPCVPKRLPKASFISPQEEDRDPDQETIFTNVFGTSKYRQGFPINVSWRLRCYAMPRFYKLENCSVRDNVFFILKGQIQRTMERGPTDGLITSTSPKQSYRSLQN